MSIPERILRVVRQYHELYRHPRLPPLEVSGLYALFPDEITTALIQYRWPDQWPGSNRPGVYLIFSAEMNLLYIGRGAPLGRRLGDYFKSVGSGCRIVHPNWKTPPKFVATIELERSFEAGALEEFLIAELNPKENGTWAVRPKVLDGVNNSGNGNPP